MLTARSYSWRALSGLEGDKCTTALKWSQIEILVCLTVKKQWVHSSWGTPSCSSHSHCPHASGTRCLESEVSRSHRECMLPKAPGLQGGTGKVTFFHTNGDLGLSIFLPRIWVKQNTKKVYLQRIIDLFQFFPSVCISLVGCLWEWSWNQNLLRFRSQRQNKHRLTPGTPRSRSRNVPYRASY